MKTKEVVKRLCIVVRRQFLNDREIEFLTEISIHSVGAGLGLVYG
jgi:hypothetical protein